MPCFPSTKYGLINGVINHHDPFIVPFFICFQFFSPAKLISKALKEAQALAQSGTQDIGKNKHFADQ